jgi:hypothetical protein
MIAKYSLNEESQDEDTNTEASIKALRQKGRYVKEEQDERHSPWWTSQDAAQRAKAQKEKMEAKKRIEEKKIEPKVKAVRNTLSTAFANDLMPPHIEEEEESSSDSYYTDSEEEESLTHQSKVKRFQK